MAGFFINRLFLLIRHDINVSAFLWSPLAELDPAVGLCKQCMVNSQAYVDTGMKLRTTLADDYITGLNDLAAVSFHAKTLGM